MNRTIYLAGGCFWGIEHLMQKMRGVIDAESGYANGSCRDDAVYTTVKKGGTGFRETVKVTYDDSMISLDAILFEYFRVVDPSQVNRQGNDVGTQYQSGIYWTDEESKKTVLRIAQIEKERTEQFHTELKELENFYPAEEYHQNYLVKNPDGYCHVPLREMQLVKNMVSDAGKYRRPDDDTIRNSLTDLQYEVTQNAATERPYENRYCDTDDKGIYVDIVTGEPMFLSSDKFDSGCGWPAFTRPVENQCVVTVTDRSHDMVRTEVRSRAGNSHLGHVFENDPVSPNGIRYCINSAALNFIPYDEMDEKGYGDLKYLLEDKQ